MWSESIIRYHAWLLQPYGSGQFVRYIASDMGAVGDGCKIEDAAMMSCEAGSSFKLRESRCDVY